MLRSQVKSEPQINNFWKRKRKGKNSIESDAQLDAATTAAALLAAACAAASALDAFRAPSVQAQAHVTKINRFHKQISGNDKVILTFNVSANLESLFTWNTKQVFVFLTAEYENSKNSLNQVSLWDHIIPDKDHANLHLELKSKYPLIDQGTSLRGKKDSRSDVPFRVQIA